MYDLNIFYWNHIIYYIGLYDAIKISKIPKDIKNKLIVNQYILYSKKIKLYNEIKPKLSITLNHSYLIKLLPYNLKNSLKQYFIIQSIISFNSSNDYYLKLLFHKIFGITINKFYNKIRNYYSDIYTNAQHLTNDNISNEIEVFLDDNILKDIKMFS